MSADARTQQLGELLGLLVGLNGVDRLIAQRIGQPAENGPIGEFLASRLFDIELVAGAARKTHDGRFASGPLAGRTVDVRLYARPNGILDNPPGHKPDYYLVLAGPDGGATGSRGSTRALVIGQVFLFEGARLLKDLKKKKPGKVTSVPARLWAAAQIHPPGTDPRLPIDPAHVELLQRLARSA
jgi:hypothetical protein